jgi:GTP-binding protein
VSARVLESHRAATAAGPEGFPRDGVPEVAILGRSNVGKSSLLNRLLGRRGLARTSATPGKTRLVHFYEARRTSGRVRLVDLPGYGYARVSMAERERWRELVEGYLREREPLRLAILLLDVRRDPGEDETLLLAWLDERRIPWIVALTKCDKLGSSKRAERRRRIAARLDLPAERVLATSAPKGVGVPELWRAVDAHLAASYPSP